MPGRQQILLRAARIANSQSFTAFSAAAIHNLAPVFRCHARTESVFVRSFPPAWLIRSFHYLEWVFTFLQSRLKRWISQGVPAMEDSFERDR